MARHADRTPSRPATAPGAGAASGGLENAGRSKAAGDPRSSPGPGGGGAGRRVKVVARRASGAGVRPEQRGAGPRCQRRASLCSHPHRAGNCFCQQRFGSPPPHAGRELASAVPGLHIPHPGAGASGSAGSPRAGRAASPSGPTPTAASGIWGPRGASQSLVGGLRWPQEPGPGRARGRGGVGSGLAKLVHRAGVGSGQPERVPSGPEPPDRAPGGGVGAASSLVLFFPCLRLILREMEMNVFLRMYHLLPPMCLQL